jgi:hypothetical protein
MKELWMDARFERVTGSRVTLVCFAEYSCYIHLDGGSHIRIESSASLVCQDEKLALFPDTNGASINALLGKEVVSVEISRDALILSLSDDALLRIAIDVGYESVTVETETGTSIL